MNGVRKILSAPVVMSSLAETMEDKVQEDHSIWVKKKGDKSVSLNIGDNPELCNFVYQICSATSIYGKT